MDAAISADVEPRRAASARTADGRSNATRQNQAARGATPAGGGGDSSAETYFDPSSSLARSRSRSAWSASAGLPSVRPHSPGEGVATTRTVYVPPGARLTTVTNGQVVVSIAFRFSDNILTLPENFVCLCLQRREALPTPPPSPQAARRFSIVHNVTTVATG